jgi:hypothetical protein
VFVRHAESLRRLAITLGYSATPLNVSARAGMVRARVVVDTDVARPLVLNVEVRAVVAVCVC